MDPKEYSRRRIIKIVLIVAIAAGTLVFLFSVGALNFLLKEKPQGTACPQEEMLCPDGTKLVRIPPDCDFAPCPVSLGSPGPNAPAYYQNPAGTPSMVLPSGQIQTPPVNDSPVKTPGPSPRTTPTSAKNQSPAKTVLSSPIGGPLAANSPNTNSPIASPVITFKPITSSGPVISYQSYQNALREIERAYSNLSDEAKKNYESRTDAAIGAYSSATQNAVKKYQTALASAKTKSERDQAALNYDNALIAAQNAYDSAIQAAENELAAAKKAAIEAQRQARDLAQAQYLGIAVKKTPLPPSPIGFGVSPSATPTLTPTASIPPNVAVTTATARAFRARYTVWCGIPTGSIGPGETRYYKIDMTKWIDWYKAFASAYSDWWSGSWYQECLREGEGALASYNQHCSGGSICMSYSCWPSCDTNLPLQSCSDFVGWVWLFGSSYCASSPDLNYAQSCAAGRDNELTQIQNELKKREDLYAGGNYVALYAPNGYTFFGCDPYMNAAGCELQGNTIQAAIGYDQLPVYENIASFHASGLYGGQPAITANNPIGTVEGSINGNVEIDPSIFLTFDKNVGGAGSIYLMIHNKQGETRSVMVGFPCLDAISSQDWNAYISATPPPAPTYSKSPTTESH